MPSFNEFKPMHWARGMYDSTRFSLHQLCTRLSCRDDCMLMPIFLLDTNTDYTAPEPQSDNGAYIVAAQPMNPPKPAYVHALDCLPPTMFLTTLAAATSCAGLPSPIFEAYSKTIASSLQSGGRPNGLPRQRLPPLTLAWKTAAHLPTATLARSRLQGCRALR